MIVRGTVDDDDVVDILVNLTVNVSNLCEGEKPHNIKTTVYNFNDSRNEIFNQTQDLVPDDKEDHILRSKDTLRLNATDQYEIINELSNSLGVFNPTEHVLYICSELDDMHALMSLKYVSIIFFRKQS